MHDLPDLHIGFRKFTDGQERAVYLDADDRQYVIGPDGERVYGVWLVDAGADAPPISSTC